MSCRETECWYVGGVNFGWSFPRPRPGVRVVTAAFWPSCAPVQWVCGGAKIFGSALLQPARSVCVSLSAFFIVVVVVVVDDDYDNAI